jgi:hypothetical protein
MEASGSAAGFGHMEIKHAVTTELVTPKEVQPYHFRLGVNELPVLPPNQACAACTLLPAPVVNHLGIRIRKIPCSHWVSPPSFPPSCRAVVQRAYRRLRVLSTLEASAQCALPRAQTTCFRPGGYGRSTRHALRDVHVCGVGS